MTVVRVRDLEVRYATTRRVVQAVRGVDLDLAPGESFGLVGESGCGKTTLVLAILGLLPPAARVSGSILIDGQEMVGADEATWRLVRGRSVALVPQGAMSGLDPTRTVGHQLRETLRLVGRVRRSAVGARSHDLLAEVGLESPMVGRYPHELSGGQRQRAVIALTLACEARLLIADEPTSGLDTQTRDEIMELLERLRVERRLSVLLVSHDLDTVVRRTAHAAVMYAGRIVERRPSTSLMIGARHPYSRGLMGSVPPVDGDRSWLNVPGSPPPLDPPPTGCAFAVRCPLSTPECQQRDPRLVEHGNGMVACLHADRAAGVSYPGMAGRRATVAAANAPVARMCGVVVDLGQRRRNRVRALDGLDLDIAPGQVVGLVGPSGSGKSTAVRTLLGLARPTAGQVLLDGHDLTTATRRTVRSLRHRTGFVHQDPYASMLESSTVRWLVAEPLRIAGHRHRSVDDQVATALHAAGLDPESIMDRRPRLLSGGQRQRVAIARAVVADPILLLCDEATTMLDASTRSGVARTIRQLADARGMAVLVVTHDLGEATHLCDRIIVLDRGRVIGDGLPDDARIRVVAPQRGRLDAHGLHPPRAAPTDSHAHPA